MAYSVLLYMFIISYIKLELTCDRLCSFVRSFVRSFGHSFVRFSSFISLQQCAIAAIYTP